MFALLCFYLFRLALETSGLCLPFLNWQQGTGSQDRIFRTLCYPPCYPVDNKYKKIALHFLQKRKNKENEIHRLHQIRGGFALLRDLVPGALIKKGKTATTKKKLFIIIIISKFILFFWFFFFLSRSKENFSKKKSSGLT